MGNVIQLRQYNRLRDYDAIRKLLFHFEEEVEYKRPIHKSELAKVNEGIDSFLFALGDEQDNCLLAVFNNNLIGFNAYHFYRNHACEHRRYGDVEITKAYVHPMLRQKGIGTSLDTAIIQRMKDIKKHGVFVNRVITEIEDTNMENIRLKRKLGFTRLTKSNTTLPNGRSYSLYARRI